MDRKIFITKASLLAAAEGQWIVKHGKLDGTIEDMLVESGLYDKYISCPEYGD